MSRCAEREEEEASDWQERERSLAVGDTIYYSPAQSCWHVESKIYIFTSASARNGLASLAIQQQGNSKPTDRSGAWSGQQTAKDEGLLAPPYGYKIHRAR
jgi:hypothetical protein